MKKELEIEIDGATQEQREQQFDEIKRKFLECDGGCLFCFMDFNGDGHFTGIQKSLTVGGLLMTKKLIDEEISRLLMENKK